MKLTTLMIACLALAGCVDRTVISNGDRIGVITKFSNKLHCSTRWGWEGELSMIAGTNIPAEGGVMTVSAWKFSLGPNPSSGLIEKIKSAMESGHRTRISYSQQQNADSCEAESDYFAVDVIDLEAK